MTNYHVVYVPGLGRDYGQDWAIKLWRRYGVIPHYQNLNWSDGGNFQTKLESLLATVDKLKGDNSKIYLVGASAGAGAVLNAYAKTDKVDGLVWICGKIYNPQTVHPYVYRKNPAFKQSMDMIKVSLDKLAPKQLERIMSLHPLSDGSVPPADTIVSGTKEKTMKSRGHFRSIAYALLFEGQTICDFLLSQ